MTSPRPTARLALACATALVAAPLAGCGAILEDNPAPAGADGAAAAPSVAVRATDEACELSSTELDSGITTFSITNDGSQVNEVYVYAPAEPAQGGAASGFSRIVTEKENIGPGTAYELTVDLTAGDYEVACKPGMVGDGIRTAVTVTGEDASLTAEEQAAVDAYRAYAQARADETVPLVAALRDAVAAGDVEAAKALYAPSRVPWESIEPVAESFGDLDPRIDAREADLAEGEAFTGWHRLEKALWTGEDLAPVVPVADQLLADVGELAQRTPNAALTPASIGNGAKELLDEVATGKVTGEEEAFSHTDLVDFEANVDGAAKALEVLRPLVEANDPELLPELDARFADVYAALEPYRDPAAPGGYVGYDTVGEEQRRELARVVDGLSEPLSRLAAAAAGSEA
jgi:iron uptake system component EfeO